MIFEDSRGRRLSQFEVDRLPAWDIEERGIHLVDDGT